MTAPRWSDEVKEAAKTLHVEGMSSREIRERLAEGRAGLPYAVSPGARTIDKWRTKWRQEGIRKGFAVNRGDEEGVENANYRRMLALQRELLTQIERKLASNHPPDPKQMAALERMQRIVDTARAKRRIAAAGERRKLTEREGGELADGSTGSMVAELAKELELEDE